MTVHCKLEICNQQEQKIYCYKTKRFTGATDMTVIEDFILKKYPKCSRPLDIQILDQHDGYVTLDNDHLEEYLPFNTEKINKTTVQPAHSSETTVTLRITLPDHILYSITDRQDITTIEETLETNVEQHQQIQRMDDIVSTPEPPEHTIPLYKDPKMGFINGHNVNEEQRDQYICDQVSADTGETNRKLSMLQGEKNGTNKRRRVRPRFRIWNDDIQNRADHGWTLLIYIVLDVCKLGKRSLFFHSERTFVKNANVREHSNPYEIPITSADWMKDMGVELQLRTVVIDGAKKKRSNVPLNFICNLMDDDTSDLSGSSCNYTKSRLALVLREDTTIHWETLVLSNEMVFKKRTGPPTITNILNIPNNTASSKRRRSKKCQTTSDQPFKRRKTQGVKEHSPQIDLLTNNNHFSVLPNPNLPISHRKNQTEVVAPGVIPNILAVNAQTIFNPTGIESLYGHSIDTMNNFHDFDFSALTNMDNSVLITGDPSLNLNGSWDNTSLDL